MILTAHLLTGAAIATKIQIAPLAFVLAFFSHYLLDFLPHREYSIDNILEKRWRKSFPDFLKVTLDICFGILLVLIFSKNSPLIFIAAFSAILTDGFTLLWLIFPNKLLQIHENFHQKVHFFKEVKLSESKKIYPASLKKGGVPLFWRIFSQVFVIFIVIFFLLQ